MSYDWKAKKSTPGQMDPKNASPVRSITVTSLRSKYLTALYVGSKYGSPTHSDDSTKSRTLYRARSSYRKAGAVHAGSLYTIVVVVQNPVSSNMTSNSIILQDEGNPAFDEQAREYSPVMSTSPLACDNDLLIRITLTTTKKRSIFILTHYTLLSLILSTS
eukprot:CAMPEP_0119146010 /NCGR_PEP_ID=MMETSP1310-20130426/38296_1 /TAXON_ID=464262 /ORGANISM="Genus nov. species nov., Strain RCC2339" /LENGTH=160 /DNA_ID=CAMNT_0007137871 /DNA_START=757 /DNA_END=1239 /DNA_ORIENTATION=+